MKMIRLEGMLLKKPLLILLLMSAALIPAVSLLAGVVSVEARYLITSAVFLLLMAAALLRRALYVEAHHRMEPFMPVDVRWHICFQSGLILLQALWVALMLCAFRLCPPLQIEEETLIRCALITAVFIVPPLGWMMNGYLHLTKTLPIYILEIAITAIAGIRMIMADLRASLLLTVFILVPGCVYVLIALYKMIRR